ncbi:MAG TPA: nucleotide sugar dehydrogenase [Armatimonadota bacterium]|nr:nucleotide sugar dehydrogenase [Armatimonadota bacterium]HOS42372.1 nucleotide sugar dehydrogenase [Armatimonadota bacterium]
MMQPQHTERIAVIGLGYVGLPVAVAFAATFPGTIGFDINPARVAALARGEDQTGECGPEELGASAITWTANPDDLRDATFFVVAVPTPVDAAKRPDLTPLVRAAETVGRVIRPGAVVVFESTVYPGVTEEICGPIIARASGLRQGVDFTLGYSPERINPGDKQHALTAITKVVSGEDAATLERVAAAYGAIITAGVHRAPSIKVAEAAKVIENTQRDLNIALMNELACIFDRLGIATRDVLAAARTKWNFLPFTPGLVGGHCIGVDPYYLTTLAEQLGYHPQVILAGRRINDGMGGFIAAKLVKLLVRDDVPVKRARVAILGLTFKENVPDIRNSRIPDIVEELRQYGIEPLVHDPLADPAEAQHAYGITLCGLDDLHDLDGLILAVPHQVYQDTLTPAALGRMLNGRGVLVDVKAMLDPAAVPARLQYWSL